MKKIWRISAIAVTAALALWSCSKDDSTSTTTTTTTTVTTAPKAITLSSSAFTPAQGGETLSLTATTPFKPSFTGVPSWITIKDEKFDSSKYTYSCSMVVAENTTYDERSATITVSATGVSSVTFKVTQEGKEKPEVPDVDKTNISKVPVNANATDRAKELYSKLYEAYGNKTFSGVQSSMSNINDYVNAVYKATGAHPALAGYDFIYLQYSPTPDGYSWVQNYTDISAQKEHYDAGGIVSYMWHWNVPASETIFRNNDTSANNGFGFYVPGANNGYGETGFDIREALKENTWQHECILSNIDKIATTFKLLDEAGIPVLFRPLHEAAGNYTKYNSNGGAWFWWGRYGASYCKQLWNLVQDRLQNYHGLNNIIWVWTMDALEGFESEAAEWYPGDDRVDIVGVDIYEDNTGAKKSQFEFLQTVTGGKKLLTVSECGNIPSPEENIKAGYPWLWFMVWPTAENNTINISGYPLNTSSYWNSLMKSSYVYNRENM